MKKTWPNGKAQTRYKAEMVMTTIDPEKPVSDDRHRDDGHEEKILQADSDTKKKKVTNKHHQWIRTRRYKYRIIGMDECKRCGGHTS